MSNPNEQFVEAVVNSVSDSPRRLASITAELRKAGHKPVREADVYAILRDFGAHFGARFGTDTVYVATAPMDPNKWCPSDLYGALKVAV